MQENSNNIELRSEEVREILGSPPGWIVRSSISVILLIVLSLLLGSFFYKYPDIISGNITIVSQNPPIPIVARSSGRLELLFVTDGKDVKKGQAVAVIENPAVFDDMIILKSLLDSISVSFSSTDRLRAFSLPKTLALGQCQSYYSSLVSQWEEYLNYVRLNHLGQQMESLSQQVVDYKRYLVQLEEQTSILKRDLDLNEKQLKRDSTLYAGKVLSEVQYEQSQQTFYKQKYNYRSSISGISNTRIQINQLKQQLLELDIQKNEQESRFLSTLKERSDNLKAQFDTWEQTYVLTAPIDGKMAFTDLWSEKQPVLVGNSIFTIVPETEQEIIGKMVIPVSGSGKVEVGQKVNIKLDNFPYMEYGLLESTITNISMVPVKTPDGGGYYTAEVRLSNGLVTNYSKELPFIQEMQGVVEIITNDRKLIERLVQPLVAIFKNNVE